MLFRFCIVWMMSSVSHVLLCYALKILLLKVQSSFYYVKNRTSFSHYTKLHTEIFAVEKLW